VLGYHGGERDKRRRCGFEGRRGAPGGRHLCTQPHTRECVHDDLLLHTKQEHDPVYIPVSHIVYIVSFCGPLRLLSLKGVFWFVITHTEPPFAVVSHNPPAAQHQQQPCWLGRPPACCRGARAPRCSRPSSAGLPQRLPPLLLPAGAWATSRRSSVSARNMGMCWQISACFRRPMGRVGVGRGGLCRQGLDHHQQQQSKHLGTARVASLRL
jgi:hypothetical protein